MRRLLAISTDDGHARTLTQADALLSASWSMPRK